MSDTDNPAAPVGTVDDQGMTANSESMVSTASVLSKPIDPATPSLLTLPGEIRNGVYEALFRYEHTIWIVRSNTSTVRCGSTKVRGSALLVTCKQIYLEAIGIFYSRNHFLLTGAMTTRDTLDIGWAMKWFDDIGRHLSLVRRVSIVLAVVSRHINCLDVLPLLRLLGRPESRHLTVSFTERDTEARSLSGHEARSNTTRSLGVNAGTGRDWDLDEDSSAEMYSSAKVYFKDKRAERLNLTTECLVADRSKEIEKYAKIPRLLRSIYASRRGSLGVIYYYRSFDTETQLSKGLFEVHEDGDVRLLPRSDMSLNLIDLLISKRICNTLIGEFIPPGEDFILDITEGAKSIPLPDLFESVHYRQHIVASVKKNTLVVKMTTDKAKADFSFEIQTLQYWRSLAPRLYTMRFQLTQPLELCDIRFDATALITAIPDRLLERDLRIELVDTTRQHAQIQYCTMTFGNIRDSLIVYLSQIAERYPDYHDARCPTIWMDGKGGAREAECEDYLIGPSEPVINGYVHISHSVIHEVARNMPMKEPVRNALRSDIVRDSLLGRLKWLCHSRSGNGDMYGPLHFDDESDLGTRIYKH